MGGCVKVFRQGGCGGDISGGDTSGITTGGAVMVEMNLVEW